MEKLDLFLSYMHLTLTEQLWYNINLFNGATRGAIIMSSERVPVMQGAIEQSDYFALAQSMIRRRNPDGQEPLELINLANKMQNAIRIAWSTESLNFAKNVWDWIGRDPANAGVQFATNMAIQMMQEYLKRAFSILKATVGSNPNTLMDVTDQSSDVNHISDTNLLYTAEQFGDNQQAITAWIMPTAAKTELLADNLKNQNRLYNIGTVNVAEDAEGRIFITSDDPNLRDINKTDGTMNYWVFGLVAGAVSITDLDDWDEVYDTRGGFENIHRTYQANWSSRIGILNYNYDETQLKNNTDDKGKFASASDAALDAPQNWRQNTLSHKQTAGVALYCKANRPSYAQPKMYNIQQG